MGAADDPLAVAAPDLWEFLSRTDAGEGLVKDPATLKIKLTPGGAMATLTDDCYGISIDAAAQYVGGLLDALEEALTRPNATIRSWGKADPKVRKKPAKPST